MDSTTACTPTAADIDNRVRALIPLLNELERSLNTEADALATRDPEALLKAVDAKRRSLSDFETALSRSGLVALLRSTAAFSRTDPQLLPEQGDRNGHPRQSHDDVAEPWEAFTSHLERCRNLNQASGGTTAFLRRENGQALRLLGVLPETPVYGLGGSAKATLKSLRSIIA